MYQISDDEKNQRRGDAGEKAFANAFSKLGHIVEHALDPYNSEWDMKIDGLTAEVKTMDRYRKRGEHGLFGYHKSQHKKCTNVELLCILDSQQYDEYLGSKVAYVRLYVFPKETRSVSKVIDSLGYYRIKPDDRFLLVKYTQEEMPDLFDTLDKYSSSKYKGDLINV